MIIERMVAFKKLVRDDIPDIIKESGDIAVVRTLNDTEYKEELARKLMEETVEYIDDETPEELADILEVVFALAKLHGLSAADLEKLRNKKRSERGAFEKRIFLVSVEEPHDRT